MLPPAAAAAVAFVLVAVGSWCNRRVLGWLPDDPPRPGRKQHQRPIPLAGVLLVPSVLPWLLPAADFWQLGGILLAALVGFLDDRQKEHQGGLDWRWKALGLGLATAAAANAVLPPWPDLGAWLLVVGFLFVLVNATNFLDNTDGVAAALSAVSLLGLSRGDGVGAAVGFAALGFLPWNWPRPRLFLGDAGAYVLGLATGIAAANAARFESSSLCTVAVQLIDFVQVVVARVVLGLPPWVGDRRHLTHIAQNLGLPRMAVAPAFALLALALAQLWRR